jgi:hypothetical protein
MPVFPEAVIIGACQLGNHCVRARLKPLNQALQVIDFHRGAARGAVVLAAPDMKENFVASIGHRVVVIMFDQHKPLIRRITQMHMLLFPPGWERNTGRQGVEMVVSEIRQSGIVDPGIVVRHLMIRPAFRSLGQLGSVAIDGAYLEKARRIPMITAFFLRAGLRRVEPTTPGKAATAK